MENPPTQPNPNSPQMTSYSTKATLSLIFGIIGLAGFGFLAGIPALILGKMELDAIKRNESPAYNHSLANVGFILGIISTALTVLAFLAIIFFIIILGTLKA